MLHVRLCRLYEMDVSILMIIGPRPTYFWLALIGQFHDSIRHISFLKEVNKLAPALKLMFSQSLTHGFIPSSLKRVVITPVFKSGAKTFPSNYRPIYILLPLLKSLSELLENK